MGSSIVKWVALALVWFFGSWFLSGTVGSLFGCAIADTGPQVVKMTLEAVSGTSRALVASYQPDQMGVSAGASVNDPTYIVDTFVGTGVLCRMILTLKGVDAKFGIESMGHGLPIDREFAQNVTAIMGNALLSEEARLNAINAAIVGMFSRARDVLTPGEIPPALKVAPDLIRLEAKSELPVVVE